ncbi:MAG TPA: hypothetical protein VLG11_03315 [Candidatus Saccharimonadales bacterium]|nr:hypothetical protein [Candidatus Saccharimonadales bacterium]
MRKAAKFGAVAGAGLALGSALVFGRETGYDLGIAGKQQAVTDASRQAAVDCNANLSWVPRSTVMLSPAEVAEFATTKGTGDIATDPIGASLMHNLGETGLKKVIMHAGSNDAGDTLGDQPLWNEMSTLENNIADGVSKRVSPIAARNLVFENEVSTQTPNLVAGAVKIDAFQAMCATPTTVPTPTK